MPSGTWALATTGLWSNSANWNSGIIADGATFSATFNRNISLNRTVTLDSNRSLGALYTQDGATPTNWWGITSSGGAVLTLDNGASKPILSCTDGTITSTTVLMGNFLLNLAGTNGFDKQGAGNVLINGVKTISGTVTVTSGQLALGNLLQANGDPVATGNVLPNITSYSLSSTTSSVVVASNTSFTFPSTVTGSGSFIYRASGSGIELTCPAGTFSGMSNASAQYGVGPYVNNSSTYTTMFVADFAPKTIYWFDSPANTCAAEIYFNGTSDLTTSTNILIYVENVAVNNHVAKLANSGTGKLVVTGNIFRSTGLASSLSIVIAGPNTLDNELSGVISNAVGTNNLYKTGTGRWILSGTNTYTGSNTLDSGTLNLRNGSALGSSSSSATTTLTAGTLQVEGGINVNKGSSPWSLNGSTIENISGANTLTTGAATMSVSTTFNITADSLNMAGAIGGTSGLSLIKSGSGTLRLSSTSSSYLGPTTINLGTLEFASVVNAGSATNSSLGKPALAQATITVGASGSAGLSHVGTTSSTTDRNINFSGGAGTTLTLDSSGSGSGAINYSSGGSLSISGAGSHTISFTGTNANSNSFARQIADGGSGVTNITKSGSNTWVVSNITATGTATCNAGVLNFGSSNVVATFSLVVNGGTIAMTTGNTLSANTTMNGGKITAILTGTQPLAITSSATEVAPAVIDPDNANGNNSFSGAASISGCIDLVLSSGASPATSGNGFVLGTASTVTVSSTGIIRTSSASNQNGQVRYKNLTLQNNSKIKLGSAA